MLKKSKSNWDQIKDRSYTEKAQGRDVYESQSLSQDNLNKEPSWGVRRAIVIVIGVLTFLLSFLLISVIGFTMSILFSGNFMNFMSGNFSFGSALFYGMHRSYVLLLSLLTTAIVTGLIYFKFKRNFIAQKRLNDKSDLSVFPEDQHIALPEEIVRAYDIFPDAGVHSSVSPSSLISHMMVENNNNYPKIDFAERLVEDVYDEETGEQHFSGEMLYDEDGNISTVKKEIFDKDYGHDLFSASGIPLNEKKIRKFWDLNKVEYNAKDENGNRPNLDKLKYDTIGDLIRNDWEFPLYETQRPAGVYIVDSAPVNTLVLAITRV